MQFCFTFKMFPACSLYFRGVLGAARVYKFRFLGALGMWGHRWPAPLYPTSDAPLHRTYLRLDAPHLGHFQRRVLAVLAGGIVQLAIESSRSGHSSGKHREHLEPNPPKPPSRIKQRQTPQEWGNGVFLVSVAAVIFTLVCFVSYSARRIPRGSVGTYGGGGTGVGMYVRTWCEESGVFGLQI